MQAANDEKARNVFSPPLCVCVSVCMCVSLPVNTTLIALALQLGDFQSKENFGVNKEGIFKVLKCVIILCISTEKAGRQEDCADQVGQMKLFTLENVMLLYVKSPQSDDSDINLAVCAFSIKLL